MKNQCNSMNEIRAQIRKIKLIMRMTENSNVKQSPQVAVYQSLCKSALHMQALSIALSIEYSQPQN